MYDGGLEGRRAEQGRGRGRSAAVRPWPMPPPPPFPAQPEQGRPMTHFARHRVSAHNAKAGGGKERSVTQAEHRDMIAWTVVQKPRYRNTTLELALLQGHVLSERCSGEHVPGEKDQAQVRSANYNRASPASMRSSTHISVPIAHTYKVVER